MNFRPSATFTISTFIISTVTIPIITTITSTTSTTKATAAAATTDSRPEGRLSSVGHLSLRDGQIKDNLVIVIHKNLLIKQLTTKPVSGLTL